MDKSICTTEVTEESCCSREEGLREEEDDDDDDDVSDRRDDTLNQEDSPVALVLLSWVCYDRLWISQSV